MGPADYKFFVMDRLIFIPISLDRSYVFLMFFVCYLLFFTEPAAVMIFVIYLSIFLPIALGRSCMLLVLLL